MSGGGVSNFDSSLNAPRKVNWFPLKASEAGLLVAICAVVAMTTLVDAQHNYWHDPWGSLAQLVKVSLPLGIVALGAAVVIIAGGIDLSIGSMIAFSGTVCASIMVLLAPEAMNPSAAMSDHPPVLSLGVMAAAIAGTLLVGVLVGSLHAWLITVVDLPPFIATLATLVGLRSLSRAICAHVTRTMFDGESTQIQIDNDGFRSLWMNLWIPACVFLVIALVIWLLLSRTVVGRHMYALGGNEQASRLSGIRTDRVKWLAYTISALAASVVGILNIAEVAVAEPQTAGLGEELNAIAAAVVGGCSLQGGVGTVPGTVLGVVFLRCVMDGIAKMIKTGADVYEGLIVGIVVVVAVAFSQLREAGRQGKQFFPGALGWIAILTLGLLAATLTTLVAEKTAGTIAGASALALLLLVKFWQRRTAAARAA